MKNRQQIGKVRILKLLDDGNTLTTQEAADRGQLSEREARHIMKELHEVEKKVFISEWFRNVQRGPWMGVFKLGNEPDAVRPPSMTIAERTERYRARNSEDGYKVEGMMNMGRAREFIVKPDPVAAMLFPWLYTPSSMSFAPRMQELEAA